MGKEPRENETNVNNKKKEESISITDGKAKKKTNIEKKSNDTLKKNTNQMTKNSVRKANISSTKTKNKK